MFIRSKNNAKKDAVFIQIVRSYRDQFGKMKQEVIKHLGTARDLKTEYQLRERAQDLIIKLKDTTEAKRKYLLKSKLIKKPKCHPITGTKFSVKKTENINVIDLVETQRIILGIHDIFNSIFDKIFGCTFKQYPNYVNTIKNLVFSRISEPLSKRSSIRILKDKFGIDLDLNRAYGSMDIIDESIIEKINNNAFDVAKKTLKGLTIAFYDVTTLYFECFVEDELKRCGFSKDGKSNQPQILLGLLCSKEGLPLGYKILPGNTFEGNTFKKVLSELLKKNIEEITIVADRGMINNENLRYLKSKGFKYVIGSKMKTKTSEIKSKITNKENYIEFKKGNKYIDISLNNTRLISTYSEQRAIKDKNDREKIIDKLKSKLTKSKKLGSLISNNFIKKYIDVEGIEDYKLNENKIKEAAKWDGLHGIETNTKLPMKEVLSCYKNLWRVEECFRINKNDLRIRPIYHWKSSRVQSHIAIIFMSFTCIKYLYIKMKKERLIDMSTEEMRDSLNLVQASILYNEKESKNYMLPSKINSTASAIYKVMKVKEIETLKK